MSWTIRSGYEGYIVPVIPFPRAVVLALDKGVNRRFVFFWWERIKKRGQNAHCEARPKNVRSVEMIFENENTWLTEKEKRMRWTKSHTKVLRKVEDYPPHRVPCFENVTRCVWGGGEVMRRVRQRKSISW